MRVTLRPCARRFPERLSQTQTCQQTQTRNAPPAALIPQPDRSQPESEATQAVGLLPAAPHTPHLLSEGMSPGLALSPLPKHKGRGSPSSPEGRPRSWKAFAPEPCVPGPRATGPPSFTGAAQATAFLPDLPGKSHPSYRTHWSQLPLSPFACSRTFSSPCSHPPPLFPLVSFTSTPHASPGLTALRSVCNARAHCVPTVLSVLHRRVFLDLLFS